MCLPLLPGYTHPITTLFGEGFWFLLSSSALVTQSRCTPFLSLPSSVPFADGTPPQRSAPHAGARPAGCAQVCGQPNTLSAER